jgi:myosin heavy subunit
MATKVVIDLEAKTDEAIKGVDKLGKEIKDVNKEVVKGNKESKESYNELSQGVDKYTGGAISGFKGVVGSVRNAIKSFGVLKFAIAATGIGLLVTTIASLRAAFTASEEGQNKFAKIMTQIGVVTGNVIDLLANFGEGLFAAGKAMTRLVKGDFKGASEAFAEVGENINEVVEGVKNFGEETKKEIKLAGDVADARAKADKAERKLITDRAEANRQIAVLREKAVDKENVSVEERIKALKEAGKINDEIASQEIKAAQLRFEAKKLENSLAKSTKEDLDEQARLQARLIELETNRVNTQKRLTTEITTAYREEEAERKRIESERKAEEKAEEKAKEEKEKQAKEKKAKEEEEKKAKELADFEEKKAQVQREIELDKEKIQSKQMVLDAISQFASAETGIGKALLIAKQALALKETVMDLKRITFKGAEAVGQAGVSAAQNVAESSKIGFPQNIITIAAAIGQGIGIIKSVKSAVSKTKAKSSGGASTGVSTPPSSTPAPPAFNIVGASGTNQLAEAIGDAEQQPVKAYVVSNDVTTAQSMDRNIVEGASI